MFIVSKVWVILVRVLWLLGLRWLRLLLNSILFDMLNF